MDSIIVPIYKQGDEKDCSNYKGIKVLSTAYKILSNIYFLRLIPYIHKTTGHIFQHNRSTIDQIFWIHQILKKKWEYNGTVHQLFIDF
jgi:hypothetical protein